MSYCEKLVILTTVCHNFEHFEENVHMCTILLCVDLKVKNFCVVEHKEEKFKCYALLGDIILALLPQCLSFFQ